MNQVANTVILPVEEYEALRAQVLSLTKERDEWKDAAVNGGNAGYLRERLAASQAREAKLRAALECYRGNRKPTYHNTDEPTFPADEALAIPTDTTALDERLAQEREKLAQAVQGISGAAANYIRSLK